MTMRQSPGSSTPPQPLCTLPEDDAPVLGESAVGGLVPSDDADAPARRRAAVDPSTQAGLIATLGNSFIAFVGAGILDLPFAFSKGGLALSTFLLVLVALVSLHCMYLIADCKAHLEQRGIVIRRYGDIGFHALGPSGETVVDLCLVITQTGFCIAYVIFIATNVTALIPESPGYAAFVWLCVPGQLLLSTIRHLKFLGWFSILADCTNIFGLSTIFWYCSNQIAENSHDVDQEPRLGADVSRAAFFFGVAIYCYEGIGMVVPIQSSMQQPEYFKLIWGFNMALVTMLFWAFGYVGYLAYGDEVHEAITLDLPTNAFLTALVRMALCTGLYFTYPVMMFPVYEIAEAKWLRKANDGIIGRHAGPDLLKALVRCGIVMFTAVIATAIPSFSIFISLVGSSCCSLLAFILPAIFSLKIQGMRPLTLIRELAVIAIGLTGAIIGSKEALGKILEQVADSE